MTNGTTEAIVGLIPVAIAGGIAVGIAKQIEPAKKKKQKKKQLDPLAL